MTFSKPARVEAERVDQTLAEDHLATFETVLVPDSAVGTGEVEVEGGPRAQVVLQLPAVELGDRTVGADDRDDERAAQVLVPRGPEDARALETTAQLGTGLPSFVGEAEPEGAIGVAEREPLDDGRLVDPPSGEVVEGLGGLLQRGVVVGDDLREDFLVGRLDVDRWREPAHRALSDHSPGHEGDLVGAEQLDGVADAHPLGAHHPVDGRTADLAGAHAVPESLRGGDDEGGGVVLVEGTAPDQVLPGPLEGDPGSHHQLGQVDLILQPLDHLVGDTGHGASSRDSVKDNMCDC